MAGDRSCTIDSHATVEMKGASVLNFGDANIDMSPTMESKVLWHQINESRE